MSEDDELRLILGGMLMLIYPDRTKDIIKSLRVMLASIKEIQNKYNLSDNDADIMGCITKSLAYMALHGNIEK